MNKLSFTICLLIFVFSTVYAQQGGFTGPSIGAVTVAEALTFRDDTPVILRGKIERFIGNERYIFSDGTGSITIEIDNRVWGSLTVDENDLIEIYGEIERDFRRIEIDVDTVRKL